jgi:small subunit ribosomal protein S16
MLVIRLTRVGKKNSPAYRVVVADKKRAVKRKFIEIIGNYNPTLTPKQVVIAKDRALFWIERGAQPSATVHNLMCDLEILAKKDKIKKVFGKKQTKKAIKAGPEEEKKEAPAEETAETPEAAETPEEQIEEVAEEAKTEEEAANLVEDVVPVVEAEEPAEINIDEAPMPQPEVEDTESRPESVGKNKKD